MAKAEGRNYAKDTVNAIETKILEVFKYEGSKQVITIDTKEFSAVCPFSGLPDIANVVIKYIPKNHCIELKSLKYYFMSFRSVGIYQEAVTNRIYNDLKKVLKPSNIYVKTIYNTRGGIDVISEIGDKI
jgi:7-cyano-7-deazaguanine reductase